MGRTQRAAIPRAMGQPLSPEKQSKKTNWAKPLSFSRQFSTISVCCWGRSGSAIIRTHPIRGGDRGIVLSTNVHCVLCPSGQVIIETER
jgi:hypothetical protein